jgi:anti-sigma-K factor RskA
VLGLASAEECAEFEKLCSQYPELIEARNQFEESLEKQAKENAENPPSFSRDKIWSAIKNTEQQTGMASSKIIPIESKKSKGRVILLQWVAAASVILFIAAGYFALKFYSENKDLKTELKNSKDLEAQTNDHLKNMLDTMKMMSDPNVAVVSLVGTQKASPSSANIYWDTTSSNVYLVVKNMPKLPSNKQYQLWALLSGKPIDLGLFDGGSDKIILKMNNAQNADAFAITIEDRGNGNLPRGPIEMSGKAKL